MKKSPTSQCQTSKEKSAQKNHEIWKKSTHRHFKKDGKNREKNWQANFDPLKVLILFFLTHLSLQLLGNESEGIYHLQQPILGGPNHCSHHHQSFFYWSKDQGHCKNNFNDKLACIPRLVLLVYIDFTIQYPFSVMDLFHYQSVDSFWCPRRGQSCSTRFGDYNPVATIL